MVSQSERIEENIQRIIPIKQLTIIRNKEPKRCCSGGRQALVSTPIKNLRAKSTMLFKFKNRPCIVSCESNASSDNLREYSYTSQGRRQ